MLSKLTSSSLILFSKISGCFCFFALALFPSDMLAQGHTPAISQRFFMQVDDLLDLGFVNDNQDYTSSGEFNINDIESNNIPEFKFRIRTNEPFRLTVQTIAEDSSGRPIADSVLQVNFSSSGDTEKDPNDFKDISKSPITLIEDSSEEKNKTYTVKYRSKTDGNKPDDIKKLNIVFTASYP